MPSAQGVKCVIRRPSSIVSRLLTFQESCAKPSNVVYEMSLMRLKDDSVYPLRLPVSRSAKSLPNVLELFLETFNCPFVLLFAGCEFRIRSQKTPNLAVCVPNTLETVSLALGIHLLA